MISIGLNWQNLCVNYITVRSRKSMTIFFQIFLMFIFTKPDSLTTKIILYKESIQNLKKSISYRGAAALWQEIEQSQKTLPHVTFSKHYKNQLLNCEQVCFYATIYSYVLFMATPDFFSNVMLSYACIFHFFPLCTLYNCFFTLRHL